MQQKYIEATFLFFHEIISHLISITVVTETNCLALGGYGRFNTFKK